MFSSFCVFFYVTYKVSKKVALALVYKPHYKCFHSRYLLLYYKPYSRYLLLLDSIRQCEGVAQLLQKSSGKEVPVKPNKGNKIAPEGNITTR